VQAHRDRNRDRDSDGDSARLFVALWPGPALRAALAAWRDRQAWPAGARPTPAPQLHLTLHFLGQVPREQVHMLAAALRQPFAPFTLHLGRPVLWPAGIAVLEPLQPPPRLAQLHATLAHALHEAGLRTEARVYRPHLTLARHAHQAQRLGDGPGLRWPVRGYALVESCPGRGYKVLQHYR